MAEYICNRCKKVDKEELTVWIDIEDIDKLEKIVGFERVYMYQPRDWAHKNEWGKIEQDQIVIRYRVNNGITKMKHLMGIFSS